MKMQIVKVVGVVKAVLIDTIRADSRLFAFLPYFMFIPPLLILPSSSVGQRSALFPRLRGRL